VVRGSRRSFPSFAYLQSVIRRYAGHRKSPKREGDKGLILSSTFVEVMVKVRCH
jgi:hypothetical protein